MKIGILSINMHTKNLNFACPVHSYAFQQFLLSHGIECEIIDYTANYYDNFEPRHPSEYYTEKYEELLKKGRPDGEAARKEYDQKLKKMKNWAEGYAALSRERKIRYDKFEKFIRKYYITSDKAYNSDLLELVDPGYDCYICATDVIWKSNLKIGFDQGYLLASKCMDNKWKIAYAASRGTPKAYSPEEQTLFFHCISDIDHISVREPSLREFIEDNSDLKAQVVLDPVLLHDGKFYSAISVPPPEEHYVLLYYVERPKNAKTLTIQCAKEHGLKVVELTNLPVEGGTLRDNGEVDHVFRYDVGPDEWIGYIEHADYVVTNSFHAVCFSVLFEKKFFVGSRKGDKIEHLLSDFGLCDCIIAPDGTVGLPFDAEIDYAPIKKKLAREVANSADFLLNAIHACENSVRPPRDYEAYRRSLTYRIVYDSGKGRSVRYSGTEGKGLTLGDGHIEYTSRQPQRNDGTALLLPNMFARENSTFRGWRLRVRIDNSWFWYLDDGSLALRKSYSAQKHGTIRLFAENEAIPPIPVNHFAEIVAEAFWKKPVLAHMRDEAVQWLNCRLSNRAKWFFKRTLRRMRDKH